MVLAEFSVQSSEEGQWTHSRGKKGRGKNCKVQRGAEESLQCMLNLNPKSTGLLKHERLGSSSAFWHLRMTVTVLTLFLAPFLVVKCFLPMAAFECSYLAIILGFV